MPTKSKPHKIKQYQQQQQQQQQQSKMKIIQAAFILPAIFGIAAGRIGDAPTGVLQAPTIQAASFGSLQASAVAAPSGAIIDPSPVLNEDLDHMDLGAFGVGVVGILSWNETLSLRQPSLGISLRESTPLEALPWVISLRRPSLEIVSLRESTKPSLETASIPPLQKPAEQFVFCALKQKTQLGI
jgi:hypothetical protein